MILLPQLILSQEVSINQASETVTLSKDKTIDVAKVIKNEQRLKEQNQELIETIRRQDSIIQGLANKNLAGLETIKQQNAQIFKLSQDVQRLTNLQLDYEEKKKEQPRLFFKAKTDYLPEVKQYIPGIGLNYFGKKFGIGISAGLFDKQALYGAEIAVSIF